MWIEFLFAQGVVETVGEVVIHPPCYSSDPCITVPLYKVRK